MPEALCIGELLIDFVSTEVDVGLSDSPGFFKAPGGAPANVAVGLSKLGVHAGFIGKIGDDPFGAFLRGVLNANGVHTEYLITGRSVRTTLAFVASRSDGKKDICFYRHPGADILLDPQEIDADYIKDARALHYGSVSLSHRPSRDATLEAIRWAKEAGLMLSYDPNLRLSLWDDARDAKQWIWEVMPYAHVVKLADEEWEFITDTDDLAAGSKKILDLGVALVVVTLGERGCYYRTERFQGHIEGFAVESIDTLGAGDAFVAAMLSQLMRYQEIEAIEDASLRSILRYANAAGALTTLKVGVIPALPTHPQIERFLETR